MLSPDWAPQTGPVLNTVHRTSRPGFDRPAEQYPGDDSPCMTQCHCDSGRDADACCWLCLVIFTDIFPCEETTCEVPAIQANDGSLLDLFKGNLETWNLDWKKVQNYSTAVVPTPVSAGCSVLLVTIGKHAVTGIFSRSHFEQYKQPWTAVTHQLQICSVYLTGETWDWRSFLETFVPASRADFFSFLLQLVYVLLTFLHSKDTKECEVCLCLLGSHVLCQLIHAARSPPSFFSSSNSSNSWPPGVIVRGPRPVRDVLNISLIHVTENVSFHFLCRNSHGGLSFCHSYGCWTWQSGRTSVDISFWNLNVLQLPEMELEEQKKHIRSTCLTRLQAGRWLRSVPFTVSSQCKHSIFHQYIKQSV